MLEVQSPYSFNFEGAVVVSGGKMDYGLPIFSETNGHGQGSRRIMEGCGELLAPQNHTITYRFEFRFSVSEIRVSVKGFRFSVTGIRLSVP